MRVKDLIHAKNIIIPECIEKIGNYWFWGSKVESVKIPKNVKEIGLRAFYNCKNLKRVLFTSGNKLEKIGFGSFHNTIIE